MVKHFSMLKEVEAKVHPQDAELRHITGQIAQLPAPPRSNLHIHEGHFPGLSIHNSLNGSRNVSVQSFTPLQLPSADSQNGSIDAQPEPERRRLFGELNKTIREMAPMLDEKIAVLTTANETLKSHLRRMESSYVHISEEIRPEARWGSTTHWAYVTDKETKKSGTERSRRDAAGANSLAAAAAALEGDFAASRSEARREAIHAKKSRKQQVDSDFDDAPTRKVAKTKKVAAAATEDGRYRVGLGITNGAGGPGKKRKTAAAPVMERSISTAVHGRLVSPRDTPGAEIGKKRKAAPGPAPKKRFDPSLNGDVDGSANFKQRMQGAGGASPRLISSPVVGTFGTKEAGGSRPTTSRGRQNSNAMANLANAPNRPSSSASNRPLNGLRAGLVEPLAAADGEAGLLPASRDEQMAPEGPGSRVNLQPTDAASAFKREEADNGEDVPMADADQPIVRDVITRAGRTSKTATPLTATFPDFPAARGRNARNKDTGSGSHASSESGDRASIKEKRIGRRNGGTPSLLAERRKAAIEADAKDEDSLVPEEEASDAEDVPAGEEGDDEDVDVEDVDDNEPRYCYCNNVSYGEMVACDNENCPKEWFHLKCAGLKEAPGEDCECYILGDTFGHVIAFLTSLLAKWYCRYCKDEMEKGPR